MVVDGAVHRLLVHFQALVQVLDVRVVLTGELDGAVALQQYRVVLADLRFDVRAGQAGIGRHQVVGMGGIVDELLDHPRDGELVGGLESLRGIGAGLLHVGRTDLVDVGQVVALLEVLEVFLDAAEFPLDDHETLVDELGRVGDGQVLVLHPVLLIDVQQGAQHGLGAAGEHILHGQDDHGGLLVGQAGGKAGDIVLGAAGGLHPRDRDVISPVLEMLGRIDDDVADRSIDRIPHMGAGLETLDGFAADREITDDEGAVLALADVEREAGGRVLAGQLHLDRAVGVHFADAEELVVYIGGFQTQAGDHLLHDVRSAERLDLIVHVRTRTDTAGRSRKGRQVTHHGGLRVFVHDHFLRTAVRLRSLVQIESGQEKGGEDGEYVPPLMVPYEGPEVGQLEGLSLFFHLAVRDRDVVVTVVCHILTMDYLFELLMRVVRAMMKFTVVMEMLAREIQKEPLLK